MSNVGGVARGTDTENAVDVQLITEEEVWGVLRNVLDPEVGINIVDLGLVYGVRLDGADVKVTMTLTTPGCPLHDTIASAVDTAIHYFVPDVANVDLDLVWDPRWSPKMITESGLRELGWL